MIGFFTFILFLYLFFQALHHLLFYLYLWQLKEYRLDRLRAHLSTKEGKRHLLFLFNFFGFQDLRRPKFTFKIILLFLVSLALSFHFFFVFWQIIFDLLGNLPERLALSSILSLLALNLFNFFLVSSLVLLFSPLTFLIKKSLVFLAKLKLNQFPHLLVIGVTGSYGKSSTKEFLATLLSTQFSILKTAKTQNTEIAVALTTLSRLNQNHQIFVVEMGAYKRGEIASICQLVKPQIGVLTGISEQHLSLFGSLEKTIKAKNELINSLPKDGLAVFNTDNFFCQKLVKKSKIPKVLYSARKKSDVYAENIKIEKSKLSFDLRIKGQKQKIILKVCGQQNIQNFLAAAAVSHHLGLSLEQINHQASQIKPFSGNMFLIKKKPDLIIVDDSFSSNPHGFESALNYLRLYQKEQKIVITPGITELGSASQAIHQNLGEKIGQIADYLVLTSDNFLEPLFAGALKSGMKKKQFILVTKAEEMAKFLKRFTDKKTIILIEGRIPEKVKKQMMTSL